MIKYGLTKTGTQRWRCNFCKNTSTRKRKDVSKNNTKKLKESWMRGFKSLSDIAKNKGVRRETLSRKFSSLSNKTKLNKLKPLPKKLILVFDGKNISKDDVLMLSYEYLSKQPFAWMFTEREDFDSWFALMTRIKKDYEVEVVVSDGQKGLIKAVKEVFGDISHQRCIIHVKRFCLSRLTLNPKTEAGKELRILACKISKVKTITEVNEWKSSFLEWNKKHKEFLKEKSINPLTNKSWFTHRKLRAVRSHLNNALDSMFLYTENIKIPSTTNCVEGGINSPLTELLWRHRGITKEQRRELVLSYLSARRKPKLPTRNVT
jgi:hypothetical protein